MDEIIRTNFENLRSPDAETRYQALVHMLKAAEEQVDWAYEIWDELVATLRDPDNHQRAIAAQLLCSLAKSDPQGRILKDFSAVLRVTRDDRFVTARHCLQAIWKIGVAGKPQQRLVVNGLASRYREASSEKNSTLIRFDVIEGFRRLYAATGEKRLRDMAMRLIDEETDAKYRKKYASLWRGA